MGLVVLGLGVRRMSRLSLLVDRTWVVLSDQIIDMFIYIKVAELTQNTKINNKIQAK